MSSFSSPAAPAQIFRMNADGLDVERLRPTGEGEPIMEFQWAAYTFSWTRGYAKGDWNIFLMDVASRRYDQLTHSEGTETKSRSGAGWSGTVFMSTRGTSSNLVHAGGTAAVTRLTNQGENWQQFGVSNFIQSLESFMLTTNSAPGVLSVMVLMAALSAEARTGPAVPSGSTPTDGANTNPNDSWDVRTSFRLPSTTTVERGRSATSSGP